MHVHGWHDSYAPYMPDTAEHTLEERIAAANDLAPAERKVARFFAESGEQVTFLPAAKIAAMLGVSTATVVRTAQRLGYAGLPELKDQLQAAVLRRQTTPIDRLTHSLDELTSDLGTLPAKLFASQAGLLDEAGRSLRAEDFVRAVEVLSDADRIVVYGQPPLGMLADHFANELRRYGRRVQAIGIRQGQTPEELLDLGAGDALIAIAYYQASPALGVVLDRCREQQVPRVLITDTLALALKGRYEIALSAPRGEIDRQPTAVVPLAVLEALQFGISGYDRERSLAAMTKRDELRERLT